MMTYEERMAIEKITHVSKCCLEKLGAKNILLFEDGFSEHYRRWIIQVSDWMFEYGREKISNKSRCLPRITHLTTKKLRF